MKLCLHALLCWLLLCQTVEGQEDPFGGARNQKHDPFRSSKERQEDDQAESRRAAQNTASLLNELTMLRQHAEAMKTRIIQQEKLLDSIHLQNTQQQLELTTKYMSRIAIYEQLISTLLCSEEKRSHNMGLEFLANLDGLNDRGFKVRLDQKSLNTLEKMVDTPDATMQRLARQAVALHHPRAIELGFQKPGDRWQHVAEKSETETATRARLDQPSRMDYFETRLEDVLDEISSDYRVNMVVDPSIDMEQLVTHKSDNESLMIALTPILEQLGLVICAREASFEVLPKDDPRAKVSLVYCVRGLLAPESGLMTLEGLLHRRFADGEEIDFEILDENRVLVTASEIGQYRVSKFLATLAKGK